MTSATARSFSSTKYSAALWFRSMYHASADLYSSSAAGWISDGLAAMENGGNLATGLFPRNWFYLARVQFFNALGDLPIPLFFGGSIHGAVDTLKKRYGQRRPGFRREGRCPW